jgi:hypothetical protein
MKKNLRKIFAVGALLILGSQSATASTIDFENLPAQDSFGNLGINSTYQGYVWGYGRIAGIGGRTLPSDSEAGWAVYSASSQADSTVPIGGSGVAAAWNWDGTQSLWVDFRSPTDLTSAKFAAFATSSIYSASTIQLYGYDDADTLMATSASLDLSSSFQTLTANFTGISFLEIRANNDLQWFWVDDLIVGGTGTGTGTSSGSNQVPEPATLFLASIGLATTAAMRRSRK